MIQPIDDPDFIKALSGRRTRSLPTVFPTTDNSDSTNAVNCLYVNNTYGSTIAYITHYMILNNTYASFFSDICELYKYGIISDAIIVDHDKESTIQNVILSCFVTSVPETNAEKQLKFNAMFRDVTYQYINGSQIPRNSSYTIKSLETNHYCVHKILTNRYVNLQGKG